MRIALALGALVSFLRFDDFTPLELELVELLATVAGSEVVVSLPHEGGRTAFDAVLPTYERLSAVATERVELPASADHYHPDARTPLNHLERCLFEPVRELVDRLVFRPFADCYDIVPAALGEEVVVHGALALAQMRCRP